MIVRTEGRKRAAMALVDPQYKKARQGGLFHLSRAIAAAYTALRSRFPTDTTVTVTVLSAT